MLRETYGQSWRAGFALAALWPLGTTKVLAQGDVPFEVLYDFRHVAVALVQQVVVLYVEELKRGEERMIIELF